MSNFFGGGKNSRTKSSKLQPHVPVNNSQTNVPLVQPTEAPSKGISGGDIDPENS